MSGLGLRIQVPGPSPSSAAAFGRVEAVFFAVRSGVNGRRVGAGFHCAKLGASMIETISLQNFKAFQELRELQLKPVTVLCGTNSCGKTTILQSILLMKQTLESQNPNQTLLLNGRFLHLGSFEDLLFQHDTGRSMNFDFTFRVSAFDQPIRAGRYSIPLPVLLANFFGGAEVREALVRLRVSLRSLNHKAGKTEISPLTVTAFDIEFGQRSSELRHHLGLQRLTDGSGAYRIAWNNLLSIGQKGPRTALSGTLDATVKFSTICPVSIIPPGEEKEKAVPIHLMIPLYYSFELLRGVFSSYSYIGPLREEPSRRYIYEDEVVEIGVKGENAAYIYMAERDTPIREHFFYDAQQDRFPRVGSTDLHSAVQRWLELMNIHDLLPKSSKEIIYLSLLANPAARTRVSIADVGFGVSQIFPIILEGLRMPKTGTLILEQPEIHLHPNLQMQLADYLISLALSGKNVVVETHSDHIVNRLVRRLVEDETDQLKDLIAVYFVTATPEGSQHAPVEIDGSKGIVNWPTDFFDQSATEQERTIRAGLAKRKARRVLQS